MYIKVNQYTSVHVTVNHLVHYVHVNVNKCYQLLQRQNIIHLFLYTGSQYQSKTFTYTKHISVSYSTLTFMYTKPISVHSSLSSFQSSVPFLDQYICESGCRLTLKRTKAVQFEMLGLYGIEIIIEIQFKYICTQIIYNVVHVYTNNVLYMGTPVYSSVKQYTMLYMCTPISISKRTFVFQTDTKSDLDEMRQIDWQITCLTTQITLALEGRK